MEFIDDVTVFHKTANSMYARTHVTGVYWYGKTRISANGSGIVRDDDITVYFPRDKAESVVIAKGDRIVKGEANDIVNSINELSQYDEMITVLSTAKNYVNSPLDNMVVIGK